MDLQSAIQPTRWNIKKMIFTSTFCGLFYAAVVAYAGAPSFGWPNAGFGCASVSEMLWMTAECTRAMRDYYPRSLSQSNSHVCVASRLLQQTACLLWACSPFAKRERWQSWWRTRPPITAATIPVHLFLCAASCLSVSQLSAEPLPTEEHLETAFTLPPGLMFTSRNVWSGGDIGDFIWLVDTHRGLLLFTDLCGRISRVLLEQMLRFLVHSLQEFNFKVGNADEHFPWLCRCCG